MRAARFGDSVNLLERFESAAQKYVRTAPIAFDKARGGEVFDEHGKRYIDFSCARGTLFHGHNGIKLCTALIDYLCNDRIVQSRDHASLAKKQFVERFVATILAPRNLDYKLLFTDPGYGVAAEIALRLARRHKKRGKIVSFTNSCHGLTEGSLSVTSKQPTRYESLDLRSNTVFMPYCGYFGKEIDTISYMRRHLEDGASGVELPAAVIVETIQVGGGARIASNEWLKSLEGLCRQFGILLIADESQSGCGRCGTYFSFERAGIVPDMVIVSNAIAGGLPMGMLLMRPGLDEWRPGEEAGIFQGFGLGFVAASEILSQWENGTIPAGIAAKSAMLAREIEKIPARFPNREVAVRGAGMIWAIDLNRPASAPVVSDWAFEKGLIAEPAWIKDEVLLVLPPWIIDENHLRDGFGILGEVLAGFLKHK
jgi:diaminobutyrate-2-oxoglutarate transaminase